MYLVKSEELRENTGGVSQPKILNGDEVKRRDLIGIELCLGFIIKRKFHVPWMLKLCPHYWLISLFVKQLLKLPRNIILSEVDKKKICCPVIILSMVWHSRVN